MEKLLTPMFRVSFPQVFVAKAVKPGDKEKFSIVMLFDVARIQKDPIEKKLWEDIQTAVKLCAKEEWPTGTPKTLKFVNPFRNGEEKEQFEGYGKGIVFVTACSKTKPGLVDQNLQKIITPEDFYPGCYARARINPYTWSYMGKCGVSLGLQNLQKMKDGDALGGRTRAEDDFSAFEDLAETQPANDPMGMFD